MIDPGEMGWVPQNEELIKAIARQLGRSAYNAVDSLLKEDADTVGAELEDMYVALILLNRLGCDELIKVMLDDNCNLLLETHSKLTFEQLTFLTQELVRKALDKYNKQCKEGDIPEQLKAIPPFNFRS